MLRYSAILSAVLGMPFVAAQAAAPLPQCGLGAITCIGVDGSRRQLQQNVPLTFGQPFMAGDVPRGAALVATDDQGRILPLQIDRISTHPDGSVRFGILTTTIPELKERETVSLSLGARDGAKPSSALDVTDMLATDYGVKIDVVLHSPQITQITFGNRSAAGPGVSFVEGEAVSVKIGDDPKDRYTVIIRPDMVGGGFEALMKIAEAMTVEINKSRTFRAYKIGEGGGYERLWVTTRANPGKSFAVAFSYAGRAKLASRTLQAWAPTRRYSAAGRAALAEAAAKPQTWLNGSIATEVNVSVPLRDVESGVAHPHLTALFDVRLYAPGQQMRTDVVLENNWTYEPAPGNLIYDVVVSDRESVVFKANDVNHYHHARWHKVIWSGGEPLASIRYDLPYFLKSRIVWNYDLSIPIADSVMAYDAARLAKADTRPMGAAFITQYMPTTGARDDIAPLPRWTALYLLSQDTRARAAMLANADAAGGIPVHYRDKETGQPVSLDRHPGVALHLGKPRGKDGLPSVANGDTPWTPDMAHQPSFAFVPYLVTGDRFYLDELLFWANWNMGGIDPGYRDGAKGLIQMNEIRGQAWSLRALGDAAMALSDDHPMKAYFTGKLANNLQRYVDMYPRNRTGDEVSPLGWVERPGVPGSTPPWQDDFLALVTGHLAQAGYPLAGEFFRWQAQATVGRWTREADGYCWTVAPGYYITVRTKAGRTIRDWRSLFAANWPDATTCPARFPEDSYPDSATGSVAFAKAMLALSSDFDIPGARAAFIRLQAETPALAKAQSIDPSWAIVPRVSTAAEVKHP